MTKAALTKPQNPLILALEDKFTAFLAQLEAGLVEEGAAIQTWLAHVKANVQVDDAASLDAAADMARLAKARADALEEDRVIFSKPLHHWKGQVDGVYKNLTGPLEQVIRTIKDRMGAYGARKAQERALVMQASASEYQAGGTPTAPIPEPAQAAGVSLKVRWTARITEPDLVPRDLCSPDPEKIQARIWYADTAATPPTPIPGLEFVLTTQTTIRRT